MAYAYERKEDTYSYDPNEDYSKKMKEAADMGDYAAAAKYEQQRNEKILGEGLSQYEPTNQYAQYLEDAEDSSAYSGQMQELLDRIMNREDFSYDLNGDALYQRYKDRYTQQGKLAMEDTMGKAAALTGGYGNSYAQTLETSQRTSSAHTGKTRSLNSFVMLLWIVYAIQMRLSRK